MLAASVWMNLQTSQHITLELERVMQETILQPGPILRQHHLSTRLL